MADWYERQDDREQKERKEKKYVTRKEFYICTVILLVAVFAQSISTRRDVWDAKNNLRNEMQSMESRVSHQITSIPQSIEQGMEDAKNPIREGHIELIDVDYEQETVTLRMCVIPKEYQEGMQVHFFITCDNAEPIKTAAELKEDRSFVAEQKVSYCDGVEVNAVVKKGNTEYLKAIGNESIRSQVLPEFQGFFGGSITYGTGVHRFDRMTELRVSVPEWMAKDGFILKNVNTIVEIDGKAIMTVPMQERERDYFGAVYVTELEEFKLREGEKLKVYCTAEDNGGRKYTYILEWGEALKNDYVSEEPAMLEGEIDPRLTIE